MFTRLSKILTHAGLRTFSWKDSERLVRMSFATQKDLDHLRETATLARKVIRMIENPQQVSELEKEVWGNDLQVEKVKSYALAERIKNTLAKLNTHPQSRDDLLQLFTEGVILPKNIFHQKRIQFATKLDDRFVYNPNSIITSQIFSIFSSTPPIQFKKLQRCMLKGYKGISKTVSVCLLWYLTRFIDEYRFHQTDVDEEMKKSFEQPIIAYWSILDDDKLREVLQNLLEQFPDQKKVYTLEELIQKDIKIGEFYRKKYGVKACLAIDQINALAQMYRQILVIIQNLKKQIEQCEEELKQVEQKKDSVQTNSNFQNMSKIQIGSLNQKYKRLLELLYNLRYQKIKRNQELNNVLQKMNLVKKISKMFDKTFYLSSMDIEQAFLQKCDLNSDRGHTIVQVREVEYARDIYKDQSLTDLCHFYVFEMNERVLKPKNLVASENELRQASQECIKILKERLSDENYFYMTFYSIYKMVSDKDMQTHLNKQNTKVKDLKKNLVQSFKSIVQATTNVTIKQFHHHFFKPDKKINDLRELVLLKMFLKTQSIIEQQKKTNRRSPCEDLSYQISLKELGLNQENAIDSAFNFSPIYQTLTACEVNFSDDPTKNLIITGFLLKQCKGMDGKLHHNQWTCRQYLTALRICDKEQFEKF